MPINVSGLLSNIQSIAHSLSNGSGDRFKAIVGRLVDAVKEDLPADAPSRDELHAMAIDARTGFDAVLERDRAAAAPIEAGQKLPDDVS